MKVSIDLDIAMELFQAADRFGVDRLKKMCESKMLASISIDNAATIFYAADIYNAVSTRCVNSWTGTSQMMYYVFVC